MILDKHDKEAAAEPPAYERSAPPPSTAAEPEVDNGPSTSNVPTEPAEREQPPPPASLSSSKLSPLERDVKQVFPAGSWTSSDGPPSAQRPVLLPPLYPPSPSSPFLLAYPPSLSPIVGRTPFLSFLRALNEALAPSTLESADRAARSMPLLLGMTYGVTKAVTGALTLGLAQATASLIEGSESKTAAKISKAHAAMYGRTSLPKRARQLLESVNEPSGLFPPSSQLELLLVPYPALERIQRATAGPPLLNVPAEAQRALTLSGQKGASLKFAERQVDRAWRAVDYRRWAWLEVDLVHNAADPSAASALDLQSPPTSLLSHLNHQLGANDPRRSGLTLANAQKRPIRPIASALEGVPAGSSSTEQREAPSSAEASGFAWQGSGRAEDALFVVICPRGIDVGHA